MAILAEGRVLLEGDPEQLVKALAGQVWRKTVAREALNEYQGALVVLSTQRYAGRLRIQVLSNTAPEPGFEPVAPDLEDVYFSALSGRKVASARAC